MKFLNPYGNGKIVIFEIRYLTDWEFFELAAFILVGVLGGAIGAIFIKASRKWAQSFRKIPLVKRWPLAEVMMVASLTGLVSYWNPYTKIPVAKLLFNLTSPCDINKPDEMGLCPNDVDEIFPVIRSLAVAFFIKGILTIITFGIVSTSHASGEDLNFAVPFPRQRSNLVAESSRWNICSIHGGWRSRWQNYRPFHTMDCTTVSNVTHIRELRGLYYGLFMHYSRCLRINCSRLNDVWRYQVVCNLGSHSV